MGRNSGGISDPGKTGAATLEMQRAKAAMNPWNSSLFSWKTSREREFAGENSLKCDRGIPNPTRESRESADPSPGQAQGFIPEGNSVNKPLIQRENSREFPWIWLFRNKSAGSFAILNFWESVFFPKDFHFSSLFLFQALFPFFLLGMG